MILYKGEKVFIITRRLFHWDLRRHFVGEVQEVTDSTIRVQGFAFIFDDTSQQFIRRDDLRIRVFSLLDAGIVINVLSTEINIEDIHYKTDEKNRRVITDNKTFSMNVSEFAVNR